MVGSTVVGAMSSIAIPAIISSAPIGATAVSLLIGGPFMGALAGMYVGGKLADKFANTDKILNNKR